MWEAVLLGVVIVAGGVGIWALTWHLARQAPSAKRKPRKAPLPVGPRTNRRRRRA
ncbi:MAG: hypothetical protein GX774_20790 [Armatimonadetes bacterium]|jgi:hypothetical protein|nr:hypothetical protein [Armatimonadota bacterium]